MNQNISITKRVTQKSAKSSTALGKKSRGFSDEELAAMKERNRELKTFLYDRLYTHHRVTRMTQKADRIMSALFEVYMGEPRQLPPHVLRRTREDGESVPRVIADYIAGMTDRYALRMYEQLFLPQGWLL